MKLTNLAIIFVILELSLISVLNLRSDNLTALNNRTIEYNKALDSAVDDGTMDLVEVDGGGNLFLNKENAITQFFISLYANFGILGNEQMERNLRGHIPIIMITDRDGFYIYYMDTYDTGEEVLRISRWSEKIPYTYEDDNLTYKFTLGTYVTIYNRSTNELNEGNYQDLAALYPGSIMNNDETYDTIRRNAVIEGIEKKMDYYINQYNNIAYQFGITYDFWLPRVDKTDWYRTIDDISMLVIFQGYPYNTGSLDTYNRYALGGARITKSREYYITKEGGIKYYHKRSCSHLDRNEHGLIYYTKEECALEGAFPCQECTP